MSMSAAKRSASQVGTAAPRRTLSVRLRLMIVAVLVALRAILQSVASARATFDFSNAACDQFLAAINKPIAWVQALSVANLQGQVVCSSFPDAIGLDISKRSHFLNAISTADFVLGDYLLVTRAKMPIMTAALPQLGPDGKPVAVILGVINLHWF